MRRLVFLTPPKELGGSGRIMWFLVNESNEVLDFGYVRQGG